MRILRFELDGKPAYEVGRVAIAPEDHILDSSIPSMVLTAGSRLCIGLKDLIVSQPDGALVRLTPEDGLLASYAWPQAALGEIVFLSVNWGKGGRSRGHKFAMTCDVRNSKVTTVFAPGLRSQNTPPKLAAYLRMCQRAEADLEKQCFRIRAIAGGGLLSISYYPDTGKWTVDRVRGHSRQEMLSQWRRGKPPLEIDGWIWETSPPGRRHRKSGRFEAFPETIAGCPATHFLRLHQKGNAVYALARESLLRLDLGDGKNP